MKIWKLQFKLNEYAMLIPTNGIDVDYVQLFDGRSHKSDWKNFEVRRVDDCLDMPLGDAPGFFLPVLSARAKKALGSILDKDVEFLEVKCDNNIFWCVNVINVIDAVDYNKSIYTTFSNSDKILAFKKYCFYEEKLRNCNIFKIPDECKRSPFVSERFKKTVEEFGLEGFDLQLVWDSEIS